MEILQKFGLKILLEKGQEGRKGQVFVPEKKGGQNHHWSSIVNSQYSERLSEESSAFKLTRNSSTTTYNFWLDFRGRHTAKHEKDTMQTYMVEDQ